MRACLLSTEKNIDVQPTETTCIRQSGFFFLFCETIGAFLFYFKIAQLIVRLTKLFISITPYITVNIMHEVWSLVVLLLLISPII